jgi:hypothetical protein
VIALALLQPLSALASAPESARLTGREAEALRVAVEAFHAKTHFPFGDLRHFTVEWKRHGKALEIIFIPDEPKHPGPRDPEVGGHTRYGQEVHYLVSLDSLKILKLEFAR